MEHKLSRKILQYEIVQYGDAIIRDLILNIENLEVSENSNCSYSFISSSQSDMDVHEEQKNRPNIKAKNLKKDRIKNLEMYTRNFQIQVKYINQKNFHSQKEKYKMFLIVIKHIEIFLEDKRSRSRFLLKELYNDHLKYIISEIEIDSSLST